MVDKTVYFATGHRKESTARVRVIPGSGKMIINGKASENYLQYSPNYIRISTAPLSTLGLEGKYDIMFSEKIYAPNNEDCEIAVVTEHEEVLIHEELVKSFDVSFSIVVLIVIKFEC